MDTRGIDLRKVEARRLQRHVILSAILIFVSIIGTIFTWYSRNTHTSSSLETMSFVLIILLLSVAIVVIVMSANKRIVLHEEIIERQNEDLNLVQNNLVQAVTALASTVEQRDPYMSGHQANVAEIASCIAQEMKLSEMEVEGIYMAALIHDIGQIYVPTDILGKPNRLSQEEFDIVKAHPEVGNTIVKNMTMPWPIDTIILQHHERLDGSGYPSGLSGDEISKEARIVAVADVLEATTAYRPYRPARSVSNALKHLERNKNKLYDPQVVDVCISAIEQGRIALIQERKASA